MDILGIDEAGRGPCIGPLVICGFCMKKEKEEELKKLGVKDSKLLSPRRREIIAEELKKMGAYKIIKVSAKEIDTSLESGVNLNVLEMKKMAQIIDELSGEKIIIDSPETNTKQFVLKLRQFLKKKEADILAENKADVNYIAVGAASILAKVARDAEIEELGKKFGDFNSGYPADEKTQEFLKKWKQEKGEFPDWVRHSWQTIKNFEKKKMQKTLTNF